MSNSALLPPGTVPTRSALLYDDTSDPFGWGLRPEQDHALTGPLPEDPEAMETLNVWFFDGPRNIAFNLHPILQNGKMFGAATVFLPDGRILRTRSDAPASFTIQRNRAANT